MSNIVAQFNPATSTEEQFTAPQSSANGALVFFNESNISIDLGFADGSSMYLPAWYHRHKCGASGSVNIQWDIHQVLSSDDPPISEIIVEAFAQGEHFPADGPLVRQTNTGNTVNTNAMTTSADAISAMGDSPGTPIITAKPSDVAVLNTWNADNSGNLQIQGDNGGVLTNLLQLIAGASPAVKLAAVGVLTTVLGSLEIDGGAITDTIQALTVAGVILKDSGGTAQGTFTNTGITLNASVAMNNNLTVAGNYIWKNGNTISRVSTFTGSGTGTYNHNAGSAPTWVGAIVSISGSATQGFDSAGSTTVHVTLGASLAFKAFTIKDT